MDWPSFQVVSMAWEARIGFSIPEALHRTYSLENGWVKKINIYIYIPFKIKIK